MPFQARLGDVSSHGGMIITASVRTIVGGQPAARINDLHFALLPLPLVTPLITGTPKTLLEGMPSVRVGDVTASGAMIITGSPTTLTE